ncbi:hypothetical protein chiPu_0000438 [Chiloscyllium punctatum]|uniref:Uncharacterized protein n=1 Tax=Chiloscyllium punctatum TaxID=137246 RepID=A0A401RV68_CHIPU|nr:hypothetical protein [Chiloscyllium punctatum]
MEPLSRRVPVGIGTRSVESAVSSVPGPSHSTTAAPQIASNSPLWIQPMMTHLLTIEVWFKLMKMPLSLTLKIAVLNAVDPLQISRK